MDQAAQPHLAKAGVIALVIKVASAVLSYAMIVVFARLLPPEEYGRFASGLNLSIIISAFATFGFATAIMRFYPTFLGAGDIAQAKGVVRLGFGITAFGGICAFAACVLGAIIVQSWGWHAEPAIMAVVGAFGLAVALSDYTGNLLRAQGKIVSSMLPRDVVWRIFTPLVALNFVYYGFNLSGLDALVIAAALLFALTLWQISKAITGLNALGAETPPQHDLKAIRSTLLPLWLSSISYALIQQFDVVIVGTLLSKADAGAYFAAQKTAQLLSLVLIAGGLVAAPRMAALYHSGDHKGLQSLCRKLALAIFVVTLAGYAFLIVTGRPLLGLFDASFMSAYPILLIIGLGAVVDALAGPNAYLMQMTSYEVPYVKIMLACYLVVVAAQFVLIPRYGAVGAAIASAGGVVLWNVLAIIILRTRAKLDPSLLSIISPPRPA